MWKILSLQVAENRNLTKIYCSQLNKKCYG